MKSKNKDKDVTPNDVYEMSVQLEHTNRFNFFDRVLKGVESAFTSNTKRWGNDLREHIGDSITEEFEKHKNNPYC